MHDRTRPDDHPFAAATIGQAGKGLERRRFAREHDLPAEVRDAGDPTVLQRQKNAIASAGRAVVEHEVREVDVIVGLAREVLQQRAFVRRRQTLDADDRFDSYVSVTTRIGLEVGCLLPPSGSTLTATADVARASGGSATTATPCASGTNVSDGTIFEPPFGSVHA